MMILSIISVAMPTVPIACLQYYRRFSVKQIMHLIPMPTVPIVYQHITNAHAHETYTYTIGTVGIGIKSLFYINKSCLWLGRHGVGMGRRCIVTKIKRYFLAVVGYTGLVAAVFLQRRSAIEGDTYISHLGKYYE